MASEDCGNYGCYGIFVNEEAMYQAMLWFVYGQRSIGVTVSIERSILFFMAKNNIPEEGLNVDTAKSKYNTFQKDLIERLKNV